MTVLLTKLALLIVLLPSVSAWVMMDVPTPSVEVSVSSAPAADPGINITDDQEQDFDKVLATDSRNSVGTQDIGFLCRANMMTTTPRLRATAWRSLLARMTLKTRRPAPPVQPSETRKETTMMSRRGRTSPRPKVPLCQSPWFRTMRLSLLVRLLHLPPRWRYLTRMTKVGLNLVPVPLCVSLCSLLQEWVQTPPSAWKMKIPRTPA